MSPGRSREGIETTTLSTQARSIKISETGKAKLSGHVDNIIGDAGRIPQFRAGRGRPERGLCWGLSGIRE